MTLAFAVRGEIARGTAAFYLVAQLAGAVLGVMIAHGMFELDLVQSSVKSRTGASQWFAEGIATFGLVMAILGTLRWGTKVVAVSVGLYITAAYWFTASTSFANPAVTIGRSFTDTFSGIMPGHVPAFVAAQLAGALVAVFVMRWLLAHVSLPAAAPE